MKKLFILFLLFGISYHSFTQNTEKSLWIDSVYHALSVQERIGQLLMVRANQSKQDYIPELDQYIKEYNLGGVCFFAASPEAQLKQTQQWQDMAKTPLLIGIDAEWGLGMRLSNTISYPFALTLGSINNDSLIYQMGYQIGQECRRMGIHLNFAPVVDINNNPNNPVINSRSFGDHPKLVAKKAAMYMHGLQDAGIIATAKHFPGHGDTGSDSHYTLPIVDHDKLRLDSVELYPYQELIKEGLSGVMVAHLYVPAYENEENLATTLSPKIVTQLLRNDMGFDGLIVTDALDMQGVTKYFPSGEIEVRALLAGNDILLLPENIPAAMEGLKNAYDDGRISDALLQEKCKKILSYKYDLGLKSKAQLNQTHLNQDLNRPEALALKEKLFEESIILLKNEELIPLAAQKKDKLAIVNFGWKDGNTFKKYASKYTEASYFNLPKTLSLNQNDSVYQLLESYDIILFNIGKTTIFPQRSFGVTSSVIELIEQCNAEHKCIVNLFGSPLAVQKYFSNVDIFDAFIISHQDNNITQRLSAQMIFGALPFKGKLPVRVSEKYPTGSGLTTESLGLIKFGNAENEGINSLLMEYEIDSIVEAAIEMMAFPGCQISVARNGRMVFQKSYGYQTYDSLIPIDNETIYDIASLTKVSASIPVLMHLVDKKKVHPDTAISKYLPFLEGSNKAALSFRNILSHQAQLQAWIPFYWYNTDSSGLLNPEVFSYEQNDLFSARVAENLYIKPNYKYEMYDTIMTSDLRKKKEYKYSDLGYYWVPLIFENFYQMSFDKFVDQELYQPMNLKHTSYLPRNKFPLHQIAPTEQDTLFRKQVLRGDVHDPGAAMLGGVCGHAGLFSTSEDLAIIFQMFLQKGFYGGVQYFDTATVCEFTTYQHDGIKNRRAMGFDKPFKKYDKYGPVCESASTSSFGHSGFTGTYAWADPEEELVYVFLSNRVYPRSDNYKISKYDIRTNIHQAIYNAINNRNFEK